MRNLLRVSDGCCAKVDSSGCAEISVVAKACSSVVAKQLAAAFALFLRAYRLFISPALAVLFGPACRFEPSCAEYARQALLTHGLVRGSALAAKRLLRCRPGGGWGYDPVPPSNSRLNWNRMR